MTEILTNVRNLVKTNSSKFEQLAAKWEETTKVHTAKSLVNYLNLRGCNARLDKKFLGADHIFNRKGVTNSALTRLKNELMGITPNYPVRAMVFGSAFHELVLEPTGFNFAEWHLRPSEVLKLKMMAMSVIQHQEAFDYIKQGAKEKTRCWETENILCKGKFDIDTWNTIGDLKTTSARSLREFKRDLVKYDYDRQAAFYLSCRKEARRFYFIGVQKREPYQVFFISHYQNTKFINKGRKKYKFLLKKLSEREKAKSNQ